MSRDAAIAAALAQAGLTAQIAARRPLSGGCILGAELLDLAGGERVVAKSASGAARGLLAEEAAGLTALHATNTVAVPEPLGLGEVGDAAALVMAYVEPGRASREAWEAFGRDLARLHAADAGTRYGFHMDNHLGATPQPNGWADDWVEFTAARRLAHQAELARQRGALSLPELARVEALCRSLDRYLPRHPKPALLHGDLWAGNALPAAGGRIAVIDPAVHVGDGWADIAMMRLFGGFDPACFRAYGEGVGDRENVDERIAVYQLYHVLNHVNLFGRGYAGQALALLTRLGL